MFPRPRRHPIDRIARPSIVVRHSFELSGVRFQTAAPRHRVGRGPALYCDERTNASSGQYITRRGAAVSGAEEWAGAARGAQPTWNDHGAKKNVFCSYRRKSFPNRASAPGSKVRGTWYICGVHRALASLILDQERRARGAQTLFT